VPCTGDSGTCSNVGNNNIDSPNFDTRWEQAVTAIKQVTLEQEGNINFGLSMYPNPAGGEQCTTSCNWFSCSDKTSQTAGVIDVAVGAGTRVEIGNTLDQTVPGGATPTGPTLREVLRDPVAAGVGATDRPNAILLITDGDATGDGATSAITCTDDGDCAGTDPALICDNPTMMTDAGQCITRVNVCAPPCSDGAINGDETVLNCGGSCPACPDSSTCRTNRDCQSGVCRDEVCLAATCANEMQDGDETSIDCGGSCGPCADGETCSAPADCLSNVCPGTTCVAAACDDGFQNGDETGVDCGGPCTATCANGDACTENSDCTSGRCQDEVCRIIECGDGDLDTAEGETDIDCGGPCKPCADGDDCSVPGDCASGVCSTTCGSSCTNGVQDNDETDIDCGGSCPACAGGLNCLVDADCLEPGVGACRVCNDEPTGTDSFAPDACKVDAALDRLYIEGAGIPVFVVGFAFETVSAKLNCHAAHGRTARSDNCPAATIDNCDAQANACYYEASDQASLSTAFDTIVSQVATCSFPLAMEPPSADRIFAYIDTDLGTGQNLQRLFRNVTWRLDESVTPPRVEYLGSACADLLAGNAEPVVVFGCPPVGG
jgi:hypothetical protein